MEKTKAGKLVQFSRLRQVKNSQKVCSCNPPELEADFENDYVICASCGAILTWRVTVEKIMESDEYQNEAHKQRETQTLKFQQLAKEACDRKAAAEAELIQLEMQAQEIREQIAALSRTRNSLLRR